MPPNKVLIDSSYLFTLFDERHEKHQDAVVIANLYRGQFVIPYVVLTEVAYLINRDGGIPAVLQFLDELLKMQFQFEILQISDLTRIREIMATYHDAKFDFVDCCIMALSERLNIIRVCTFDHRHFMIFRPKHVGYLTLLP